MADLQYIEIVHSGDEITLSEFVNLYDIVLTAQFTLQALLSYETNTEYITQALPPEIAFSGTETPIFSGVLMRVPKDKISREIIATRGNIVVPNRNFNAFFDNEIKSIISDVNYKPLDLAYVESGGGKTFRFKNEFSVWIWCKGLGSTSETGKLINLTPFIDQVTTNMTETGGNFSLSISSLIGDFVEADTGGRWSIKESTAYQYANMGDRNFVQRTNLTYVDKDNVRQQKALFHNVIKSNDVVFIKFETLEMERDLRELENTELTLQELMVSEERLTDGSGSRQKQIFDMIGLVDTNSESTSTNPANVSISVSGRDLMKLLLEDGEYFFPTDLAGITAGVQGDGSGRALERLVTGDFNFFNAYVDRTIDFTLRFVFNMLSNIKVCDDKLFRFYGDKRTTRYEYSKVTENNTSNELLQSNFVEGIWQIIKLVIDPELSERRIVDTSIVSDQGNLFSFISGKIVQDPFAEFYGDTYGNMYYFITRKPPYDKESYSSLSKLAIDIEAADVYSTNFDFDDEDVYSWYRITPTGNFFGGDESVALSEFPAVFFNKYADIWGSRPLSVVSNYVDYIGIVDKGKSVNLDNMVSQVRQDLAYVIETNAYKPFTRKGSIVLKGDRRIKRGMCVRLKGTKEIFHVDSVSQSATTGLSLDRTTTIGVSRGMVEEYIEGKQEVISTPQGIVTKLVSYFNIIDLKKNAEGISQSTDFRVDDDIFNFFMKSNQFKL